MKALNGMVAASYISSTEFTLAKETSDDADLDAGVARLELKNHERVHFREN